jgi:hypothetical protein
MGMGSGVDGRAATVFETVGYGALLPVDIWEACGYDSSYSEHRGKWPKVFVNF